MHTATHVKEGLLRAEAPDEKESDTLELELSSHAKRKTRIERRIDSVGCDDRVSIPGCDALPKSFSTSRWSNCASLDSNK